MAEKFLYYLGAGASAQALPTVKPINDEVNNLKNFGMVQAIQNFARNLEEITYSSAEQDEFLLSTAKEIRHLAKAVLISALLTPMQNSSI